MLYDITVSEYLLLSNGFFYCSNSKIAKFREIRTARCDN